MISPTGKTFFCGLLIAFLANGGQSSARYTRLQESPPVSASPKKTEHKDEVKPPAATQEEQPVRLESYLIQLNVFVTSKDGQPVTDLHREDFQILENGRPQKITGFGLEVFDTTFQSSSASAGGSSGVGVDPSRQDRSILILVDDLHVGIENLAQARQALLNFINYEVRDDDQVSIVSTSGSLGFLQQLTNERSVMRLALSRLAPRTIQVVSMSDRPIRSIYQAELIVRNDREVLSAAVGEFLAENPGFMPEQAERLIIGNAQRIIQQSDLLALATINTISNAIMNLQRLEGAKLAILVSDGFLLSTVNNQARDRLVKVMDAATRASVVVHTVDSRGLATDTEDITVSSGSFTPQQQNVSHRLVSGDRRSRQDTLVTVAHETGGTAFINNNDLRLGLQTVLQQNNIYYSLAYMANPASGKNKEEFRKIEVKVNGRANLLVRFQRGYAIQPVAAKKKNGKDRGGPTPEQQIKEALGSIAPVRDVVVGARTNFISMPDKGPLAITGILIDPKSITLRPEDSIHKGQLDLLGLYYNSDGKLVHDFSKTLQLNLRTPTYRAVMQDGIQYVDYWNPAPGLYQIRIAVRDVASGKVGTSTQWLEVPDLATRKLALSDIFFLNEPSKGARTGTPGDAGSATSKEPAPVLVDPRLLVPTWRKFEKGGWINFGLFVYHQPEGANNDYLVQVQLVRNNTPVFTSPLRLISKDERVDTVRLFYGSRLSLEGLAPGKYFLQVIVIDRTSRERAFCRIDFSVG